MRSRQVAASFLISALPLAWLITRFNFLCDDAFISFRYSRNLAHGLGLSFNPGTAPPVEGYTNLLWVLWCAVFERFGLAVEHWSRATSIALAAVLLFLLVRLAAKHWSGLASRSGWVPPLVAGLFVALHPGFGVWATSGMETMAFSFCLFMGFERLALDPARPRTTQSALCFVAAALLRADGAVLCAGALGGLAAWSQLEDRSELRRSVLRISVVLLIAVSLQVLFRRWYHGDLLPNTAHAKVSFGTTVTLERGALYVSYFLVLFPAVALAPLFGFLRPASAGASVRSFAVAALIPFAVIYTWSLLVGGDYMAFGRFLIPAIPFAALLLACGSTTGPGQFPGPIRACLLVALLVTQALPALGWSAVPESVLSKLNFRLHKPYESQVSAWNGLVKGVERGTLKGRLLAERTREGDSLVAGAVGAQAYYSDLFIYDRLGLVTREVALREVGNTQRSAGHDKGVSATFFLKYAPTIMHLDLVKAKATAEFVVPPKLARDYVARELPVGEGSVLRLIVRRDSHLAK